MPVLSSGLVDLPDSGSGTGLVKITRDSKGRVEGTQAATTTDLAEGSNLYFTDGRADARVAVHRADLASSASGKGAALVGFSDTLAPAFLKTLSDLAQAREVDLLRFIPKAQWAAIHAGTSAYDAAADVNGALATMRSRGGALILPHGKIRVDSSLLLDYTGALSNDENNRITIRGQGSKSSEIYLNALSGNTLGIVGGWPYSTTVNLENVRLRGNGNTTRALRASGVSGLNLTDVICQGGQYGWEFEDCLAVSAVNSSAVFNTYGAKLFRAALTYPNLINMLGGSIGGNTIWGMEAAGGCNLNLRGVGIEGNGVDQPLAAATSWGVKLIDAGAEGGVACSIDGCYFEVNNGQADLWVVQSSRPVGVHVAGTTFNRISATNYVTNNVRLETSGTGKINADLRGNGYFVAGTYVRDATRRTVLGTGVADSVNYEYGGSQGAADVDKPTIAQSGRLADPDCAPQAWVRGDGASSTVSSSRRLASYARNSVGNYTVTFEHSLPAAKCYQITLEGVVPLCWQLVSEAGASVNFTVKNSAGALTDPTRVFVTVWG